MTPTQLDLFTANAAGQLGMTRAHGAASERAKDACREIMRRRLRVDGWVFGDDVRDEATKQLERDGDPLPTDWRFVGSLFQRLGKQGIARPAESRPSKYSHGSPRPVWRVT